MGEAGIVNDHIYERVLDIGKYIAHKKATVRATAEYFGVSKSTVHKDVTNVSGSIYSQ